MLFTWFSKLEIVDKITVIIGVGLFIIFALILFISRIKYEWKREELSEYWNECQENKAFQDLDTEKDIDKDSLS